MQPDTNTHKHRQPHNHTPTHFGGTRAVTRVGRQRFFFECGTRKGFFRVEFFSRWVLQHDVLGQFVILQVQHRPRPDLVHVQISDRRKHGTESDQFLLVSNNLQAQARRGTQLRKHRTETGSGRNRHLNSTSNIQNTTKKHTHYQTLGTDRINDIRKRDRTRHTTVQWGKLYE